MSNKDAFIKFHCPRWNELPDMDLYMDQVLTFLNSTLQIFIQPHQGKPITSTMINNYVKNGIVTPPIKKRYTKRHIAYLIVVCILKSTYSMDEISDLIEVQIEKYPQERAYDYFCSELESCLSSIFLHKKIRHITSEDEGSLTVDLIRNTIQSVVYLSYVKERLHVRNENGK